MSLIGIIPARGGSKGIPRKNLKSFYGKPLIAWTIEVAKTVSHIDSLVVSTDDKDIAAVAQDYGAEIPFIRPQEISQDKTPGIIPVLDVLKRVPGYDEVLILQPTSPLRTANDINNIIEIGKSKKASAVVSVTEAEKHPYWSFRLDESSNLIPWVEGNLNLQRQDLPGAYCLNGALYWGKTDWVIQNETFVTEETLSYIMPKNRSIDLDTIYDWEIGEFLMSKKNL